MIGNAASFVPVVGSEHALVVESERGRFQSGYSSTSLGDAEHWPAYTNGGRVGRVTIAIWSPRLEKNIGYVWLTIELSGPDTALEVDTPDGRDSARTVPLPFIDPKKDVPKT